MSKKRDDVTEYAKSYSVDASLLHKNLLLVHSQGLKSTKLSQRPDSQMPGRCRFRCDPAGEGFIRELRLSAVICGHAFSVRVLLVAGFALPQTCCRGSAHAGASLSTEAASAVFSARMPMQKSGCEV